jgi:outer membrane receptor protein involved in Fe transport
VWSLLLPLLLAPPAFGEELTVASPRFAGRLGDGAASALLLDGDELVASPAPAIDDVLRRVPGFTLFRRAGSRAANPTAQGASLRGLGGSGASRAVVAADGIPLNDPFGGWVYWGRVPRAAVERVEVERGGASELWGSGALAGVVHLVRRRPAFRPALAAEAAWGTQGSGLAEVYAAGAAGAAPAAWSLAASGFSTDGYFAVPEPARGAADARLEARWTAAELGLERAPAAAGPPRLFLRLGRYAEERGNGTRAQRNDTEILEASAGLDAWRRLGAVSARAWGSRQVFHQSFTAVAADRARESLTRLQRVPTDAWGVAAHAGWQPGVASRHRLGAALEARAADGVSHETLFAGERPVAVATGGSQRGAAAAAEDLLRLGARATLRLGLRLDSWENRGRGAAPPRRERAWSPRLGLAVALDSRSTLHAAAYRAFRAPTLNELYRPFRVGDVVTLANPDLDAERLAAVEAGWRSRSPGGRLEGRATLFWMEVDDAVANLTLGVEPGLITRRRGNLARTRSRGLELDWVWRPAPRLEVEAGALLVDAEVRRSRGEAELAGRRVPQVARVQATLAVARRGERTRAALQGRFVGGQFEDDRNQLELAPYSAFDFRLDVELRPGLEAYAAVENLLDERAEVGRSPLLTLGPPRQARLGLRLRRP